MNSGTSTTSDRSRRYQEDADPTRLFRKYARTRSIAVRNTLVETHMPLVLHQAQVLHSRLPREIQFDDLVSAGADGLIRAVEAFDNSRNIRFATFASFRISGAMLDFLRAFDHVPRLTRNRTKLLSSIENQFRAETGRQPNPDELRARLNVDDEQWERISNERVRRRISIDEHDDKDEEEEGTLTRMLVSDTPPPECDPTHTSLRDTLLRHLKLGEALLIRLYYIDQLTMKEIGRMLGRVTETCISCRHKAIMQKMRDAFDQEELSALIGGEYR